jgi:Ca-activated chloride channel homolog
VSFGEPIWLLLLVIAAAIAAGYVWIFARRRAAEARYGGAALRTSSYSRARQVLKAALVVAAGALIAFAAARPRAGTQRQLLQRQGTDVIIALDVSLSMTARDVSPTRLDRAKGALTALLDHLQGDRVGLVTFAGSATLRFPLTTDLEAARAVVMGVNYKDGGLQAGTSIGAALRQASEGFANDQTRSKILLLVSDGEDLGDDATAAASFVSSEGIALDTIGVGETTPVPLYVVNPRTGQVDQRIDPTTSGPLLTAADPKALQQLAHDNRGHYYNGNSDDFAVQLSDELSRMQKTRFDSGEGDVPIERFQILIAIAVALLLLEYLLPAGRASHGARLRERLKRLLPRARGAAGGAAEPASGGD